MRRVAEMFKARRNSVNSSSVVGKTLNSTGFRMYIETIMTTTDIMMSVTIRPSSTTPGSGVIKAITMPRTAIGAASSFQFERNAVDSDVHGEGAAIALVCAKLAGSSSHTYTHAGRLPFISLKMYAS